jgi:hypothetical protein
MRNIFSIHSIFQGVLSTIRRFPAVLLACLAGTVIGYLMIHADDPNKWMNEELALTFAAPLFIAAVLFGEAKKLVAKYQIILHAAIIVFLVAYYLLLPDPDLAPAHYYIRHLMWGVGFVLIVTFIPFVLQRGTHAVARFWEYCRALVVAFVLTGIWAVAFQAGLFIALASVGFLFDFTINEARYAEIWITLLGIFSPLFFLSRLARDPSSLEEIPSYPKEVRLFSQFVLVPLVCVYFLILYAYTIRVWITSDWPDGQLAYMILGFSLLGVVTYIALYPLRSHAVWVKHAGTVLFAAMIPQVGMLFWALKMRVGEYGITENRYLVFVFGWWLLGMAVYFIVSRSKDIRLIPITICILAILTSFGPWGAFSVSERSQVNRLENMLIGLGLFANGKYVKPNELVSNEDVSQVSSIIRYLHENHDLDGIKPWFGDEFAYSAIPKWQVPEYVVSHFFEIKYYNTYEQIQETGVDRYRDQYKDAIESEGFKYVFETNLTESRKYILESRTYSFVFDRGSQSIIVKCDGEALGSIPLLDVAVDAELSYEEATLEDMTVVSEATGFKAKLILRAINATKNSDGLKVNYYDGLMLFTPLQ